MTNESVSVVISRAERTLMDARRSFQDLCGKDLSRRIPGLKNLVVYGRSFTFVLQNLRSFDREGFDQWYLSYEDEMRNDELMKFFAGLRNDLLKKGNSDTGTTLKIESLSLPEDAHLFGPKPPGATCLVMGDDGPAWIVKTAEGVEEKHYVQVPSRVADTSQSFRNPPRTHLGKSLKGKDTVELCNLYLQYLERMLVDAKQHFL